MSTFATDAPVAGVRPMSKIRVASTQHLQLMNSDISQTRQELKGLLL
jgi:hypothetical protein